MDSTRYALQRGGAPLPPKIAFLILRNAPPSKEKTLAEQKNSPRERAPKLFVLDVVISRMTTIVISHWSSVEGLRPMQAPQFEIKRSKDSGRVCVSVVGLLALWANGKDSICENYINGSPPAAANSKGTLRPPLLAIHNGVAVSTLMCASSKSWTRRQKHESTSRAVEMRSMLRVDRRSDGWMWV
ncbi:hypothetical protein EVAR_4651_1 [Eumeta japonica]|uniref:Uncharacterized protein n=1 Tax=Eumeta variegata TaxID=151549 RepID=A0A4C1YE91_EUMVA|nr:hypothetical protein EVAR_4651_1 [Eumeta japonica]